jgi:hypothetical protein
VIARTILFVLSTLLVVTTPGSALTPTQTGASAGKARSDAATRARVDAENRARLDAQVAARARADAAAQAQKKAAIEFVLRNQAAAAKANKMPADNRHAYLVANPSGTPKADGTAAAKPNPLAQRANLARHQLSPGGAKATTAHGHGR